MSLASLIPGWLVEEDMNTKELAKGALQFKDWTLVIQMYSLCVLYCLWALQISHTGCIFSAESVLRSQILCIMNCSECDGCMGWCRGIHPNVLSSFQFLAAEFCFVVLCVVFFFVCWFVLNRDQSIWPRRMKLSIPFTTTYICALSCNNRGILCRPVLQHKST